MTRRSRYLVYPVRVLSVHYELQLNRLAAGLITANLRTRQVHVQYGKHEMSEDILVMLLIIETYMTTYVLFQSWPELLLVR